MQVHKLHLTMASLRKAPFLLCLLALLFTSSCSLPWGNTTPATACGTVTSTEALSTTASNAMKAGTCFLQAYQKCQAATLIYIDQDGILPQDYGKTTRTLTVDVATCKVSEVVQTPARSATYTCNKIEGVRGSLHLISCGADGTFLLVLDATIQ
jgi:hypothetical protein